MKCEVIKECTDFCFENYLGKESQIELPIKKKIKSKFKKFEEKRELSVINRYKDCPNEIDNNICKMQMGKVPKVSCGEKASRYCLQNDEKRMIILYRMDGGVIVYDESVNGIQKCDYLYVIGEKDNYEAAILVELKGEKIAIACNQIISTLELYKDYFSLFLHVYARIVGSSFSEYRKNLGIKAYHKDALKLQARMMQKKGNLKFGEKYLEEKYSELGT